MSCTIIRTIATGAVLSALLIGCQGQPDFDSGVAALKRGDYATAFQEMHPLAEQGNPVAQYNVALMYFKGRGVPQNSAEAERWYTKSAEQGNTGAQRNLGFMYLNGQGIPRNYTQAEKWFRER